MKNRTCTFLIFALIVLIQESAYAGSKYWVGGSGNWSDTLHWSDVFGGAGGARIPSLLDDIIVDENSFISSGYIEFDVNALMNSFVASSNVNVELLGGNELILVVNKQWVLNGNVENKITSAVHLIGRHLKRSYQFYDSFSFVGINKNPIGLKVELGSDQVLTATGATFVVNNQTCPGACNGDITVTAVGGTGPYEYQWVLQGGPGANTTSQTVTQVCSGSQTVVIRDLSDPPGTPPFVTNVNMGPAPFVAGVLVATDVTCPSGNDGLIAAFVSGGTAPYQYQWDNGGGTNLNASALVAGTYTLTVTDDLGCVTTTPPQVVDEPPAIVVTPNPDQVPLCGTIACTEDVIFTVVGGNGGPFTFNPSNSATDMCPGTTFNTIASDRLGCPMPAAHTASDPPVVTASAVMDQPVTCLGVSDGEATASGAGGVGPYDFLWLNVPGNPTTANVTGLTQGDYSVEVTDQSSGCRDTATVTITSPSPQVVTATASITTIVSCLTASNGEATASGAGGTPTYLFNWYDAPGAPTSPVVTGLPVGTYNVEVRDQDGCVDTAQVDVVPPAVSPVTASISALNNVICVGLPTGDATAAGAGGTSPYTFLWYDLAGNPTSQMVSNLDVGLYNVEVTDVDNCKDTATVDIQAPNPPVLTTTIVPVLPTCGIQCDGGGTASTAGGQSPYTFDWFDSPLSTAGPNIASLCPGAYQVAVEDVNGCKDTVTLDLNVPLLTVALDSKTDVACTGDCSGEINVSATGGTAPYAFLWYDMNLNPTSDSLTGVCARSTPYNVEVRDAAGCLDSLTVSVTEPPIPLLVTIDRQVDNICVSDCAGEVDLSISGGVAPYNFQWTDSNGIAPVNPAVLSLTNLCNGSYVFEVTDAANCTRTVTVDIVSPILDVNFTMSPICWDDTVATVQAQASVSAPFIYEWLDPVTGNINDPLQIDLRPGTYDLKVTDRFNCTDTFPFTFAIPLPINASAITANALCQGICDGTINATVTGGTAPYNVSWYDMVGVPTAQNLTAICPGTFNMAIEDNFGCRDTLNAVTVTPTVVITSVPDSLEATCLGVCDGKGWVTVNNGTLPYTYDWFNDPANSTTDTAFNLCVGTYQVAITDGVGCVDTADVVVTPIPSVTVSIVNQVNNVCSQNCIGQAEAVLSGGTPPYQFVWTNISGRPTTNLVTNLCNGSYFAAVQDDNGCRDTAEAVIISASALATFNNTNPSCGGYNDGSITANLTGGSAPLALKWLLPPTNPTSNFISGLAADTFNLEVSDAVGCIDTFQTILVDPFPVLLANADHQSVSCFGVCDGKAWTAPTGGTNPYQYRWYDAAGTSLISITDSALNLCFGQVSLTIEDVNGCIDSGAVSITNPFTIDVATSLKPQCFGALCDGAITAHVLGSSGPYTYAWDNPLNSTDSTIVNLCPATYTVIVSNTSGCIDSAKATVLVNPEIFKTVTKTDALCTNTTNGSATMIATGGSGPFTYTWVDSLGVYTSTIPNPSNLGVGTYYGTATDSVGCSIADTVNIDDMFFIAAYAGNDLNRCLGDSMLLVGTGGVNYLWSTGSTNDSIVVGPTTTTTYTLTTTNGPCTDADAVTITINDLPIADALSNRSAMLEGMSAQLSGIGAGTGGIYDWTPPVSLSDPTIQNPVVTPIVSTRYYLTVTDANGCKDTSSVLVKIIESILYPDGVSPNGDGINDDWPILYIENFPQATVEIYNRWGQQLFFSVGYNKRWDGTFNGEDLPVGTYYFIIDLGEGLPKYTGPITIFR